MTPWTDLPESERARLIRNEKAQRTETKRRGLPVLPCEPEHLYGLQKGMCTCNECRGTVPLEVGKIVIAHIKFRGGVGSPGHVPHNVALWNHGCNQREAGPETSAKAKGERFAVNKMLAPEPVETDGYKKMGRWPKGRKIASRSFGR